MHNSLLIFHLYHRLLSASVESIIPGETNSLRLDILPHSAPPLDQHTTHLQRFLYLHQIEDMSYACNVTQPSNIVAFRRKPTPVLQLPRNKKDLFSKNTPKTSYFASNRLFSWSQFNSYAANWHSGCPSVDGGLYILTR